MSTDPSRTVDISEGDNTIVDYTYSVKWRETTIPFEKRMDKYSRYSFLPQHLEARVPCLIHACLYIYLLLMAPALEMSSCPRRTAPG